MKICQLNIDDATLLFHRVPKVDWDLWRPFEYSELTRNRFWEDLIFVAWWKQPSDSEYTVVIKGRHSGCQEKHLPQHYTTTAHRPVIHPFMLFMPNSTLPSDCHSRTQEIPGSGVSEIHGSAHLTPMQHSKSHTSHFFLVRRLALNFRRFELQKVWSSAGRSKLQVLHACDWLIRAQWEVYITLPKLAYLISSVSGPWISQETKVHSKTKTKKIVNKLNAVCICSAMSCEH